VSEHADHELVRAVARVAHMGEVALACCLDCRTILNVWPAGGGTFAESRRTATLPAVAGTSH
jgi:hypothetical protein